MTSFALLLNGNGGNGGSSSGVSYVLAWVSLALVGTAIIIIALAVFSSELWYRHKRRKSAENFARISSAITKASRDSNQQSA